MSMIQILFLKYTQNVHYHQTLSQVFLEKIGKSSSKMEDFMNKRLEEFSNHSIVIDGMLKNNTSETNIFSEMSRKSRTKGAQNLNLIYAYDINAQEPVASSVYPGNML